MTSDKKASEKKVIAVDLLLIKLFIGGRLVAPKAVHAQWLELTDPSAWSLYQAHAMSQGVSLTGISPVYGLMHD